MVRKSRKLVVVSNRGPYRHEAARGKERWVRSAGGLVAALDPVLQMRGGVWVSAKPAKDFDSVTVPSPDLAYDLAHISLKKGDQRGFYEGISNAVLWPLLHGFEPTIQVGEAPWSSYLGRQSGFRRHHLGDQRTKRPDMDSGLSPHARAGDDPRQAQQGANRLVLPHPLAAARTPSASSPGARRSSKDCSAPTSSASIFQSTRSTFAVRRTIHDVPGLSRGHSLSGPLGEDDRGTDRNSGRRIAGARDRPGRRTRGGSNSPTDGEPSVDARRRPARLHQGHSGTARCLRALASSGHRTHASGTR